jgi:hypothetical protein
MHQTYLEATTHMQRRGIGVRVGSVLSYITSLYPCDGSSCGRPDALTLDVRQMILVEEHKDGVHKEKETLELSSGPAFDRFFPRRPHGIARVPFSPGEERIGARVLII